MLYVYGQFDLKYVRDFFKAVEKDIDAAIRALLETLRDLAVHYHRDLMELVSYTVYSEEELASFPHPLAKKRWSKPMWNLPRGAVQTVTGEILRTLAMGEIKSGHGYWVGWKKENQPSYLVYVHDGTRYMFPRMFIFRAYHMTDYDKMFKLLLKRNLKDFKSAKK